MKFFMTLILVALLGGGGFIYLSPQFEQKVPNIEFKTNGFWNLKDKLQINLSDASGIKYYKVTFIDEHKNITLDEQILNGNEKSIDLSLTPPKLDMFYKGTNVKIKIDVVDNSKWNFLNGNTISQTVGIKIDNKRPVANVVNNSRYIKRGGSAVVVVKVKDANLKEAYINFNNTQRFELIPFYKENYYVALIAWDINTPYDSFQKVNLIAIDKAGNKTTAKVPLYIQNLKIKEDDIKLSKRFIQNVSTNVLEQMNEEIPENLVDRFLKQNKEIREQNINTIKKVVMANLSYDKIDSFKINKFKRLRGSRTFAGFGERRSYFFEGQKIDEAWHLGMDWASIKQAAIKVSNGGKVIFSDYLGIYGNSIIVDHGMGLSTIYSHATNQYVNVDDMVSKNKKIATTGATGAALGDHLHFGVLIQGIEVNPIEWMDGNWIKTRITNILDSAKKSIDKDN
jgi:murein DD-endopeptidase MepM/ murein hydrolase activator NlpD